MTALSVRRQRSGVERDRGTVLILVLVLIVIAALIVIPLLTYATTVLRANHVLSDRTERLEAGKAGLRMALADTLDTWDRCENAGENTSQLLPSVTVNGLNVETRCYWVAEQSALLPDQLRFGLVATQVGQEVPVELKGNRFVPVSEPPDATEWIAQTTTESLENQVWLPELPTHTTAIRSAAGFQMPTGDARPDPCTVYFPGAYEDRLSLAGDVFFTSGVYYFKRPVEVLPDANVVVGDGTVLGCASSTEAALTAIGGPSAHNISGLGVTWMFGDEAKLVVTNEGATEATRLVFNRRYVAEDDGEGNTVVTPRDISIVSVNGELDETVTPPVIVPLHEPDLIDVPLHAADAVDAGALPPSLLPSILTPKPRAPDAIDQVDVSVVPRSGALEVAWEPPLYDGGLPIIQYQVVVDGLIGCETSGATSCVVTGLTNGTSVNVSVTSSNERGESLPSSALAATPSASGGALAVPGAPSIATGPTTEDLQQTGMYYDDALLGAPASRGVAHIAFVAPASTGGSPITGYDVTMTPLSPTPGTPVRCNGDVGVDEPDVDMTDAWRAPDGALYSPPLVCDFPDLDITQTYEFEVGAINATGESLPSSTFVWDGMAAIDTSTPDDPLTMDVDESSDTPSGVIEDDELTQYIDAMERHLIHAGPPPRVGQPPIPIVDVRLVDAADVELFIPGYIAVPQGRVLIHNPQGHELSMIGGILAAQYDVDDSRAYDAEGNLLPESVDLGFVETIIQRQFRIVSTVGGRTTSTAVVQINQTGAWAVNSWAVE